MSKKWFRVMFLSALLAVALWNLPEAKLRRAADAVSLKASQAPGQSAETPGSSAEELLAPQAPGPGPTRDLFEELEDLPDGELVKDEAQGESAPENQALVALPTAAPRSDQSLKVDEPFLTPEEIRELESPVEEATPRPRSGGGAPKFERLLQQVAEQEELIEENAEEGDPQIVYRGQARGYSLLHLMHPRARTSVERQIKILIDASLEQAYLGVLVDGTFGWDAGYFESVVRRLNASGQRLILQVYFTNGSSMRSFDTTPLTSPFVRTDPTVFRSQIRFDPGVRQQYLAIVQRVRPILELNKQLNPQNLNNVVVMLEDNLDVESYRAMRSLAQPVLGHAARFVRNPCPGCWPGTQPDSQGDPLEFHAPFRMQQLTSRDGYSLDGNGFVLPFETGQGEPIQNVEYLLVQALQRQLRYFALWRFDRQGLATDEVLHPDQRSYAVPTEKHALAEKIILRFGLEEIAIESN